jgi:hypothetical protein
MFTEVVITFNRLAIIFAGSPSCESLFSRLALKALALTAQRLEVVEWAGSTRGQTCGTVVAWRTALSARVGAVGTWLEGEHTSRASSALTVTIHWGLSGVTVAGALETRHQACGAVGSMTTYRDTVAV